MYKSQIALVFLLHAALAGAANLRVDISPVMPGAGDVKVALCSGGLTPKDCGRTASVPASAKAVSVIFARVSPGRYAVLAFQDRDGTGQLRRGKLGIPLEPFGVSRQTNLRHAPTFETSSFAVDAEDLTVSIVLLPRRNNK